MRPLNSKAAPPDERRAHPRKPCSHKGKIARYERGARLNDLKFEPVRLKDLSAGGFSFRTAQWPQHAELAFQLADQPAARMLLARVRRVEHVKGRYIVGCQFVRSLSKSSARWSLLDQLASGRSSFPPIACTHVQPACKLRFIEINRPFDDQRVELGSQTGCAFIRGFVTDFF